MAHKKKSRVASLAPWELDDQQSRNLAKKEMQDAHEILRPMVCFGQKILLSGVRATESDLDRVLSFVFRQTLEFVDGVDLLLRHHMVAPAGVQARSAIDSAAQTCYLAMRGTSRIAAAYQLSLFKSKRLMYEGRLDVPTLTDDERQEVSEMATALWSTVTTLAKLHLVYDDALTEINKLKPGEPWYRAFRGPRTVHAMLKELDLSPLSVYYRELNPIVHNGMPPAGLAAVSPDGAEHGDNQWLRPIRSATDWWTMPLKVGIVATDVATQAYLYHFNQRYPTWMDEYFAFHIGHAARCERAGMSQLGFSPELRNMILAARAAQRGARESESPG